MNRFLKLSLYGAAVLVLVLVLVITAAVLRPLWVVNVVNASQSAVQIDSQALRLSVNPLHLRWQQLELALPQQIVHLGEGAVEVELLGWFGDAPFWAVEAETLEIVPTANTQTQAAQAQSLSSDSAGPPDFVQILNSLPLELFRFRHIRIDAWQLLAADAARAPQQGRFELVGDGQLIQADLQWQQAAQSARLAGQFTPQAQGLLYTLNLSFDEPRLLNIQGDVQGDLQVNSSLQLSLASAEIVADVQGAKHRLQIDSLRIAWADQDLSVEELTAQYQPADLQPVTLRVHGEVAQAFSQPDINMTTVASSGSTESTLQVHAELDLTHGSSHGQWQLSSTGLPQWIATAPLQPSHLFPLEIRSGFKLDSSTVSIDALRVSSPSQVFSGDVSAALSGPARLTGKIDAQTLFWPLAGSEQEEQEEQAGRPEQPEHIEQSEPETTATASASAANTTEISTTEISTTETSTKETSTKETSTKETSTPQTDELAPVFSQQSIDWSWLRDAEIDVQVSSAKLFVEQAEFRDLQARLVGQGGQLKLAPLSASLGEGGFATNAQLVLAPPQAGVADQASVSVDFSMQGISLQEFGLVPEDELSGGAVFSRIQLAGQGNSAHDLATSLQGEIILMIQDALLANDFVELVGSDMLMETVNKLNPFYKDDPTTQLECGLVRFGVADGVLRSRNQLVLETSKMEIIGDGQINLGSEQLDVTFSPSAKAGVGVNVASLVKFLKLGGHLRQPVPEVDALGVLQSGAAIGAALSTGGVSVLAEGLAKRVINAGSACSKISTGDSAPQAADVP